MSAMSISPSPAVPSFTAPATGTGIHRSGTAHASVSVVNEQPTPVSFALGAAGDVLDSVRVVVRNETGHVVASFALAALSGTQNITWTPQPGTPAGAYAAYWEGSRLASQP